MEDLPEIGAIWRGETRRALKSGRVLVLLILFLLLASISLAVVGGAIHLATAPVRSQIQSLSGKQAEEAEAGLKQQMDEAKKGIVRFFFSEDQAVIDSLASLPLLLLAVFKLMLRVIPFMVVLMGFDQLAGEVGPKSVRYLVVRAKRSSIVLGKFLSQLTIGAMLLLICVLFMVAVTRFVTPDFSAANIALWSTRLVLSALTLSFAYLALTALFSALTRQSGVALVLNFIALFVIWFISLVGGWFRFPGEAAGPNSLAILKSESPFAYLRYISVWDYADGLLYPNWQNWLASSLVHAGFGLLFLGLAMVWLRRSDL